MTASDYKPKPEFRIEEFHFTVPATMEKKNWQIRHNYNYTFMPPFEFCIISARTSVVSEDVEFAIISTITRFSADKETWKKMWMLNPDGNSVREPTTICHPIADMVYTAIVFSHDAITERWKNTICEEIKMPEVSVENFLEPILHKLTASFKEQQEQMKMQVA